MIITLKIGTENIKEFERMKEMNKELLSEPQARELRVKLEPRRGAKVAPNTQEFRGDTLRRVLIWLRYCVIYEIA